MANSATVASSETAPASSLPTTPLACGSYTYRPQSSDLADSIVAIGTDCATALAVVAAAPDRPSSGQPYAALGFTCVPGEESQPPGGGMARIPYRCDTDGGAAVTFDRY